MSHFELKRIMWRKDLTINNPIHIQLIFSAIKLIFSVILYVKNAKFIKLYTFRSTFQDFWPSSDESLGLSHFFSSSYPVVNCVASLPQVD